MINGSFDVYETYTARIVTFENDLQVESVSNESLKSNPQPNPTEGSVDSLSAKLEFGCLYL